MIRNIQNMSRNNFKRINFYPSSNSPTKDTHAYISIYGNELEELPPPRINHPLWFDGIQLKFDDVEEDYKDRLFVINDTQSDKIIKFINDIFLNEKQLILIVHCYAGISRSAAVGKFTNDIFKLDLPQYQSLNIYNRTVYAQLVRAWERKISKEDN